MMHDSEDMFDDIDDLGDISGFDPEITCHECPDSMDCEYAFDPKNVDGLCIVTGEI